MPPHIPGSVDSLMKFEDLSGVSTSSFSNPYDALIEACEDDPVRKSPSIFKEMPKFHAP